MITKCDIVAGIRIVVKSRRKINDNLKSFIEAQKVANELESLTTEWVTKRHKQPNVTMRKELVRLVRVLRGENI